MRSTQTPKSINECRGAHVVDIVDLSFVPILSQATRCCARKLASSVETVTASTAASCATARTTVRTTATRSGA